MFKKSLWALVIMIFVMILIGGLTRLTGSGLSIVEWQPILGILPPLSQLDWMELFQKYQTSPEYQKINLGMTLAEFKNIFWLEYIHRVWGRLLGIVLAIPLIFSWIKPHLKSYRLPLLLLAILIGGQGFMGWYMVESGLSADPHVSPYRLTAHLLLGILILGLAFWMTIRTSSADTFIGYSKHAIRKISISALGLLALISLTILYGGLVAGHKAGLIYNTYPLMGGNLLPSDLLFLQPFWENLWANAATVQFIHRWLGTLTAASIIVMSFYFWTTEIPFQIKVLLRLSLGMAILQFVLGLYTLLLVVPVDLAVIHQAGALVLFLLLLALVIKTAPVWK